MWLFIAAVVSSLGEFDMVHNSGFFNFFGDSVVNFILLRSGFTIRHVPEDHRHQYRPQWS